MGGARIPGPLNDSSVAADDSMITSRSVASAGPVGSNASDPIELSAQPKISKVNKDWTDPPAVTSTFTPTVSGATLQAVLIELKKLSEWGTGGGNLSGGGVGGEISAEPTEDGKSYTMDIKGQFFMTLVQWKEYPQATKEQQASWDAMLANLKKHEGEHVAISHRAANALVKSLVGTPVLLAAQKIADSGTNTQTAQDDFDARTAHGDTAIPNFPRVFLDTTVDPVPKPAGKPTP